MDAYVSQTFSHSLFGPFEFKNNEVILNINPFGRNQYEHVQINVDSNISLMLLVKRCQEINRIKKDHDDYQTTIGVYIIMRKLKLIVTSRQIFVFRLK